MKAVYDRLISRTDVAGFDDAQALDHIGELTDLYGQLRRMRSD